MRGSVYLVKGGFGKRLVVATSSLTRANNGFLHLEGSIPCSEVAFAEGELL